MKKILIFLFTLLILPVTVQAKVKIEDTVYDTLEEAIEVAKEGDTLTLLDDLDVSDTTKYHSYYNFLFPDHVTLDLNGNTVTTAGPNVVWLGNNLTIRNGFFTARHDYAIFLGDITETSHITLEDIEVSTGINIFNTLDVTLKNVTATGSTYYAVWLDEHATATIESGTFRTNGVAVVGITKVEPSGESEGFDSVLTIKGGNFISNENNLSLSQTNANYLPPIIQGGVYDFDVTEFITDDYECKEVDGKFHVGLKTYDRDVILNTNDNLAIQTDGDTLSEIFINSIPDNELDIDKKDVSINLGIENVELNQEAENKFIEKLPNSKIARYLDITINVVDKATDTKLGNLSKLKNKITLSIPIPDDLKAEENVSRKYYILREHENIIDMIEPTVTDNTLQFETDLFSIYAIAYEDIKEDDDKKEEQMPNNPEVEDKKEENKPTNAETEENKPTNTEVEESKPTEEENPATYDKLFSYLLITIVSFAGIAAGTLYIKRKEF